MVNFDKVASEIVLSTSSSSVSYFAAAEAEAA
jgi:hypothetical protein